MRLAMILLLLGGTGAMANQPGERPETLTLLRELQNEPLSRDATRDVPPVIDERAAACLTESPARPATADPVPMPAVDAMGNPTGGVQ